MMSAMKLDGKYFSVLKLPELEYILGTLNKFDICFFFTSLCDLLELIRYDFFFASYQVFVLMVLLSYVNSTTVVALMCTH